MHCHGDRGCRRDARYLLVVPDGAPCPGAYVCAFHAQGTLQEYWDRLKERWTAVEVDALGNRRPNGVVLRAR